MRHSGISPERAIVRAVRENPRPTRHLEHVEPGQIGKPLPRSVGAPAWDLGAQSAPSVEAVPEPLPAEASADDVDPAEQPETGWFDEGSRKRTVLLAGGVALVVVALGLGSLAVLGADRSRDTDADPAFEWAALDLTFPFSGEPGSKPTDAPSPRDETKEPEPDDAGVTPPWDGTATSGQGGTSEGGAGAAAPGIGTADGPEVDGPEPDGPTGGGGGGAGTEGGTGQGGGGATPPRATDPPPTSDPTPTRTPTPTPTPTASGEPPPDPTPSPSVSPTPSPSGAP